MFVILCIHLSINLYAFAGYSDFLDTIKLINLLNSQDNFVLDIWTVLALSLDLVISNVNYLTLNVTCLIMYEGKGKC